MYVDPRLMVDDAVNLIDGYGPWSDPNVGRIVLHCKPDEIPEAIIYFLSW